MSRTSLRPPLALWLTALCLAIVLASAGGCLDITPFPTVDAGPCGALQTDGSCDASASPEDAGPTRDGGDG
jgi:hypothetical protein